MMKFIELHIEGGIEFMGVLFLMLVSMLVITVLRFKSNVPLSEQPYWLKEGVKEIGYFSFFWGLLGQIIGLMSGFQAIEAAGEVSQGLMAGGLFVSFITTAYGLIILLLSLILNFIVRSVKS